MDGAAAFFEQHASRWSSDALKNLNDIRPDVQQHLKKVYLTLAGTLLCAAVGVYLHLLWHLGGLLSIIGFIGCTLWLLATPPIPSEERKRLNLLGGAALCQGMTIGPLVEVGLDMDASLIFTALLSTSVVFACFTGAALLSRRRDYLFLGGVISSALSTLALLRLVSFFTGGGAAMFQLELYGGLLIFLGYVLFDTQMVVERASNGRKDYIKDALEFFMDFVAIFVRLLVILMKNNDNRERREKAKQGRTKRR